MAKTLSNIGKRNRFAKFLQKDAFFLSFSILIIGFVINLFFFIGAKIQTIEINHGFGPIRVDVGLDGKWWDTHFIIIYLLAILWWVVLPIIVYFIFGKTIYFRVFECMFIIYSLSLIFSIVCPTSTYIGSKINRYNELWSQPNYQGFIYDSGNSVWNAIVNMFYKGCYGKTMDAKMDFPSFHVLNVSFPLIAIIFMTRKNWTSGKVYLFVTAAIASLLIWVSTIAVSQHYILDGVGAYAFIVIGGGIYYLLFKKRIIANQISWSESVFAKLISRIKTDKIKISVFNWRFLTVIFFCLMSMATAVLFWFILTFI